MIDWMESLSDHEQMTLVNSLILDVGALQGRKGFAIILDVPVRQRVNYLFKIIDEVSLQFVGKHFGTPRIQRKPRG